MLLFRAWTPAAAPRSLKARRLALRPFGVSIPGLANPRAGCALSAASRSPRPARAASGGPRLPTVRGPGFPRATLRHPPVHSPPVRVPRGRQRHFPVGQRLILRPLRVVRQDLEERAVRREEGRWRPREPEATRHSQPDSRPRGTPAASMRASAALNRPRLLSCDPSPGAPWGDQLARGAEGETPARGSFCALTPRASAGPRPGAPRSRVSTPPSNSPPPEFSNYHLRRARDPQSLLPELFTLQQFTGLLAGGKHCF